MRISKGKEYQGIFLTELFAKVMGYTIMPLEGYNLVAECKKRKE